MAGNMLDGTVLILFVTVDRITRQHGVSAINEICSFQGSSCKLICFNKDKNTFHYFITIGGTIFVVFNLPDCHWKLHAKWV